MNTIKQKLEELYDILIDIVPLKDLKEDPFEETGVYYTEIIETITSLLLRAASERERIEKENDEIRNKIELYTAQLQLENVNFPKPKNIGLEKELLRNEFQRICVYRERLKSKIKIIFDEMQRLEADLYGASAAPKDISCEEVSFENLKNLESRKEDLKEKVKELESKRQQFYDDIELYGSKIGKSVSFTFQERICDLRKILESLMTEYEMKKDQYEKLACEIKKKERVLNIERRTFVYDLSESTLSEMQEYDEWLKSEQSRLFDEIFDRIRGEIIELSNAVGKVALEYPRSEDGLVKMKEEVEKLYPVREMYREIVDIIKKRTELIEKMMQFEKVASDPKRLFKSSFQLNTEEKFRNSAYPSLLKMEEAIFQMIDAFEMNYGPFFYEGLEFRKALKGEIENRIINRTVFISRCDSPYRKKR